MGKITFRYRPPKQIVPPDPRHVEPEREEAYANGDVKADRWWYESSHDLRQGLEVSNDDTVPGDLLDELFKPLRKS